MTFLINNWNNFAIGLFVFLATFLLQKLLYLLFVKTDKDGQETNQFNLIKELNPILYISAAVIIFYSIPSFRVLGTALLASAGIIAAIAGFASQQAFSNIVSGLFIVIFKLVRPLAN